VSVLLALTWSACTGGSESESAVETPLGRGWIAAVVREPGSFEKAMSGGREGWVALHRNDWPAAAAAGGTAAPRALDQLARFEDRLDGLSRWTWAELQAEWAARGSMPADSLFSRVAELAAKGLPAEGGVPPLAERMALHRGIRDGGRTVDELRPALAQPLVREAIEGGERTFYDPMVYGTLAMWYRRQRGNEPLAEAALFSASLTGAPTVAADLEALGLHADFPTDDVDGCRQLVRDLDAQLDPWRLRLANEADADGRALLGDLRLVETTRARLLVELSLSATDQGHAQCALAWAELARDHQDPRAVGPVNSPHLFVALAAANLGSGRTREALDALQVLVTAYPEVVGLDDTAGALAVIESIDRRGDSREN
jgi:hypothetical protein